MTHKTAGEIVKGDRFLMAGGHYIVREVYETVDDEIVKISFSTIEERFNPHRTFVMALQRDMFFITT